MVRKSVAFVLLCSLFVFFTHAIDLDQIYKYYSFYPMEVEGIRSMQDGNYYTILSDAKILKCSYRTGEITDTIFDYGKSEEKYGNIFEYEFNHLEDKILLATNKTEIYRHSYEADFLIYDRNLDSLKLLSKNGRQRLTTFSPDGKHVAFVRNNNLYYSDTETGFETQVTFDGERNKIINGYPDWVYEEEFSFSRGFFWSKDGDKIAYYKFDESMVPFYKITMYDGIYPDWYEYKYPKAGERNSAVSIWVYDLNTGKNREMDIGNTTDQYVPRIKWTNNNSILSIIRLNRHQNRLDLILSDSESGNSHIVYTDIEEKYIKEVSDDYLFFVSDDKFIIKNESDGYLHAWLYDINGDLLNRITDGNWDIDEILGVDTSNNVMYYTSMERGSIYRDVYSVGIDGSKKVRLSMKQGTNYAYFNSEFSFYIEKYSSSGVPPLYALYDLNGKEIRILEDNKYISTLIKREGFVEKEFFTIPTDDDFELNAFEMKPENLKKGKKYPVLFFVYGGPESQEVLDEYSNRDAWFQYLVKMGYIVVCVDNRGTDGKGEEFRKSTYLNLGKYELQDQVTAFNYFAGLSYVETDRIGVFGWSYGGFMSLLCMTRASGLYKMGIAVAPVTHWKYYDTIYTERFMKTPEENSAGYDENSPINYASNLTGKLLIIHGSADDNVHLQNTLDMTEALVQYSKSFDMHIYRNRDHSIYGGNTSYHLYSKMTNFILENL